MTTALPPVRAAAVRKAKPNGWWGMAIFLAGEATLFGALIGSYVYLRFNTPHWPPPGVPEPPVVAPLVLTAVLIVALPVMRVAERAAVAGRRALAWWAILLAFAIQNVYLGFSLHLYTNDLDRFQPQGSAYGSIYYVLVGAAHAHVALGLLFDVWLLLRLATRLTSYRVVGVQAIAFYWYVVTALTAVCVLVEISPHL